MNEGAPVAALPMYDFPEIAWANDAVWRRMAARLRAHGFEAPAELTRGADLLALWRDQNLVFGQTCVYPLSRRLREAVVVIATPEYGFPGCEGASHRSYLVCRAGDPPIELSAFRGCRAAVNAWDSNTGMNLFRATIAPVARGAPFFASVIATGSHAASLEAVADGRAELAAVDCVTFGLMRRLRPGLVERIRIVAETPLSPGLPFVTSARWPGSTVAAVRDALVAALADLSLAKPLAALGLTGLRMTMPSDYERVLEIEREAATEGYPQLA
jgi:ABC-type phosphate/phosphonate transport system substrate-binding protein